MSTPKASAVGKGMKAWHAWTRTNTAAGRLPRFSGRSPAYVRRAVAAAGFSPRNPNEWTHLDGSYVRIDPPHGPGGPYRSHNEPHYHKGWRDAASNTYYRLDDAGYINADPGQHHIIGRSPRSARRRLRGAAPP